MRKPQHKQYVLHTSWVFRKDSENWLEEMVFKWFQEWKNAWIFSSQNKSLHTNWIQNIMYWKNWTKSERKDQGHLRRYLLPSCLIDNSSQLQYTNTRIEPTTSPLEVDCTYLRGKDRCHSWQPLYFCASADAHCDTHLIQCLCTTKVEDFL